MGVEGRNPGYLVREETQREKMRSRVGKRFWGFEKRLEGGGGSLLTRMCLEEMKERMGRRKDGLRWEKERDCFFRKRGVDILEEKEEGRIKF